MSKVIVENTFGDRIVGEIRTGMPNWWTEESEGWIFNGTPVRNIHLKISKEEQTRLGFESDELIMLDNDVVRDFDE